MGTVFLIGAGPGDPGLLTRRGAAILRRADVVVHDALIDPRVLELAPARALRIDAGKRGGGRSTAQSDIHAQLIEAARTHRIVVRLKGGDPFVFGRGGEELSALRSAGVPCRVVPGVTAGLAGLAWAGIAATQRGLASSVTLVTGHCANDTTVAAPRWRELARAGGTLVIYMAVGSIDRIVGELLAGGLPGATPAAAIERATWPDGRIVRGTLEHIVEQARTSRVAAPALFVVGDVVGSAPERLR